MPPDTWRAVDKDLSVVVTQMFNARVSASVGKFDMLDVLARTPLIGGGGANTFMTNDKTVSVSCARGSPDTPALLDRSKRFRRAEASDLN
jgi:hypothetical protein